MSYHTYYWSSMILFIWVYENISYFPTVFPTNTFIFLHKGIYIFIHTTLYYAGQYSIATILLHSYNVHIFALSVILHHNNNNDTCIFILNDLMWNKCIMNEIRKINCIYVYVVKVTPHYKIQEKTTATKVEYPTEPYWPVSNEKKCHPLVACFSDTDTDTYFSFNYPFWFD